MRCTDCEFMKETIPAQLHYVYCTKYKIEVPTYKVEVPTWLEFVMKCQFKEHEEEAQSEACSNNRANRGHRSKTSLLDDCMVEGELLSCTADQQKKLKR